MKVQLRLEDYKSSILTQICIGDTFDDVHKYVTDRMGVEIKKEDIVILDKIHKDPFAGIGAILIVNGFGWVCSLSEVPIDYKKEFIPIGEL